MPEQTGCGSSAMWSRPGYAVAVSNQRSGSPAWGRVVRWREQALSLVDKLVGEQVLRIVSEASTLTGKSLIHDELLKAYDSS